MAEESTDDQELELLNEWGVGGSGLPLDGASVEVLEGVFCMNTAISPTNKFLKMKFRNTEDDSVEEQYFSIGEKSFDIVRGGGSIVPRDMPKERVGTDKDRKQIMANSGLGRLVTSAAKLRVHPRQINPTMFKEHGMFALRQAGFWVGSFWSMGTRSEKYTDKNGNEKEALIWVFTSFNGSDNVIGDAPASSTPAATTTAVTTTAAETTSPAPAEQTTAPEVNNKAGVDPALWDELVAKAVETIKSGGNHDAFVDIAVTVEGVSGNKSANRAVMADVGDKSVWVAAQKVVG